MRRLGWWTGVALLLGCGGLLEQADVEKPSARPRRAYAADIGGMCQKLVDCRCPSVPDPSRCVSDAEALIQTQMDAAGAKGEIWNPPHPTSYMPYIAGVCSTVCGREFEDYFRATRQP